MTTIEAGLCRYPPSIPSRCSSRKCCVNPCPPCLNIKPPGSNGTSSVHFQVTYTCNGPKFLPCYYPKPICCQIECPPKKPPPCYARLLDSCGNPICVYF